MKKITKVFLLVIVVLAIVVVIKQITGEHYREEYNGKIVQIKYEYVNFRSSPKVKNNIIGTISLGQNVILTGHEYDYLGGSKYSTEDKWIEVEYNGTTGWVVSESINWSSVR